MERGGRAPSLDPMSRRTCPQTDANLGIYSCIYIYSCLEKKLQKICPQKIKYLKKFEPLIYYISIYIYGVHCGKVLILENVSGRKIILNIQPQEGTNTQYIEDITFSSTLPKYAGKYPNRSLY